MTRSLIRVTHKSESFKDKVRSKYGVVLLLVWSQTSPSDSQFYLQRFKFLYKGDVILPRYFLLRTFLFDEQYNERY